MKKTLFILLIIFITSTTYSQELIWSSLEVEDTLTRGEFLHVDSDNNIYVGAKGNAKMYLIKYSNDGSLIFKEGDDQTDLFMGMAATSNDNIYLTGSILAPWQNQYGLLRAYSSEGDTLFSQYYNPVDERVSFRDICVDQNDMIYICGIVRDVDDYYKVLTIKYAPDGEAVWVKKNEALETHYGIRVNVGINGEVYVSGIYYNSDMNGFDYFALKYAADGTLLSRFDGINEYFSGIYINFTLLDNLGNLYIGGDVEYLLGLKGFLIKIKDSTLIWSSTFNYPDQVVSLADGTFDVDSNIIICGAFANSGLDGYVIKVSGSGELLQEKTFEIAMNSRDYFSNLIHKDGYNYFCGITGDPNSSDILVMKTDSAFETIWMTSFNGPDNGNDNPYDLILDNDDNLIVTGRAETNDGWRCITLKYSNPLAIIENEEHDLGVLSIYPNPTHSEITISAKDIPVDYINIYNKVGQIVLRKKGTIKKIDVSNLSSGLYIIEAVGKNTRSIQKLLIQ